MMDGQDHYAHSITVSRKETHVLEMGNVLNLVSTILYVNTILDFWETIVRPLAVLFVQETIPLDVQIISATLPSMDVHLAEVISI